MEIGTIPLDKFAAFIRKRFDDTDKGIHDDALNRLLDATRGHPYGTQELAYFVWGRVPTGHYAHLEDVEAALGDVLRSEHSHFSRIWDDATHNERLLVLALADEPSRGYGEDYRARHDLPSPSHIQRAVGALVKEEVVGRDGRGVYFIAEPFFGEWVKREQAEYSLAGRLKPGARGT
jgi:hypothetical protein